MDEGADMQGKEASDMDEHLPGSFWQHGGACVRLMMSRGVRFGVWGLELTRDF